MKTLIIAEIGSNYDGDFQRIRSLIKLAKDCGADAVKFQLIPPFKEEWIDYLIGYCKSLDVEFIATPFNQAGIDALKGKVKYWKIASTEAANKEFVNSLFKVAEGKILMSDGAIEPIDERLGVIPMACVIKYPARIEDYTFACYKGAWGLSDHTESIHFPAIAVAAGAFVIEKHFTDDKTRIGPDHHFALNPKEFKEMVDEIRLVEKVMTNPKKTITTYVGRKITWPN